MIMPQRCAWANTDPLYLNYHDTEWGVPVHEDRKLFEFLILEGTQAGLSWSLILKKRAEYVQAFDGFDPSKVASYNDSKLQELIANPGIVRNKLKIQAAIQNAHSFLAVQRRFGSFDAYICHCVIGKYIPILPWHPGIGDHCEEHGPCFQSRAYDRHLAQNHRLRFNRTCRLQFTFGDPRGASCTATYTA